MRPSGASWIQEPYPAGNRGFQEETGCLFGLARASGTDRKPGRLIDRGGSREARPEGLLKKSLRAERPIADRMRSAAISCTVREIAALRKPAPPAYFIRDDGYGVCRRAPEGGPPVLLFRFGRFQFLQDPGVGPVDAFTSHKE